MAEARESSCCSLWCCNSVVESFPPSAILARVDVNLREGRKDLDVDNTRHCCGTPDTDLTPFVIIVFYELSL